MNPDGINKIIKNALDRLKNIRGFEKVRFIVLYGSAAEQRTRADSDIDLCIDLDAENDLERSRFRLNVLSELPEVFDIQIFEQLPLYIRKEVLKGEVIFLQG